METTNRINSHLGTCGYCEREFTATKNGTLAEHGFRISDHAGNYFGYRSGTCPSRAAVEDSPSGIILRKNDLSRWIGQHEALLASLESGTANVPCLSHLQTREERQANRFGTVIGPDDARYKRSLESWKDQVTYELKNLRISLERAEKQIAEWKPGTLKPRPEPKKESRFVLRDKYGPGSCCRPGPGCSAFGVFDKNTGTFAVKPTLTRWSATDELKRLRAEEVAK